MVDLYIVSGFLGSGKTTFIQKMLSEMFEGKNIALVENDFGLINVDAEIMRKKEIEVQALNAGCICCNITGDFQKSLSYLVQKEAVDVVIIEPSGVALLSEILGICQALKESLNFQIKTPITIVDESRYALYRRNFGLFYQDQIQQAATIVCNRLTPNHQQCLAEIQKVNPTATLLDMPWELLSCSFLALSKPLIAKPTSKHHHRHIQSCTLLFTDNIAKEKIVQGMGCVCKRFPSIIRIKGFFTDGKVTYLVQGVSTTWTLETVDHAVKTLGLCFIGKDFREDEIAEVFSL